MSQNILWACRRKTFPLKHHITGWVISTSHLKKILSRQNGSHLPRPPRFEAWNLLVRSSDELSLLNVYRHFWRCQLWRGETGRSEHFLIHGLQDITKTGGLQKTLSGCSLGGIDSPNPGFSQVGPLYQSLHGSWFSRIGETDLVAASKFMSFFSSSDFWVLFSSWTKCFEVLFACSMATFALMRKKRPLQLWWVTQPQF